MAVAVSEEVQINTQLLAAITLATARTAMACSLSTLWGYHRNGAVGWSWRWKAPSVYEQFLLTFKALVCESQCFVREDKR